MQTRMGERCVAKVARLLTRAEPYGTGTEAAFPHWLEFMEQIGNRNSIFTLMAGNPSVVGWISTIFSEGGIHAQRLIRHPEFLESYVSLASAGPETFAERFASLLETARDDEEFILEVQVTRSQALIQILTEYLNHPERRRHRALLAELADATVDVCTRYAWRTMVRRFGLPAGARDEGAVHGFAVLALGKLGSRELHFGSDLDLVFLFRENGTTAGGRSHNEFYTKLAQRLGTLLTAPSQFGFLYELDQRLRPFGNKGVLVPSLGAYREFLPVADVWSYQAFTRIRPLCGDAALAQALIGDIGRAWRARALERPQIAGAVREMLGRLVEAQAPRSAERERVIPLKFAIGGMIGFEFLRQAHFLIERSAVGEWTPPPGHETIERLEPAYGALADLDERLAFYVSGYRHEAAPEHFERLAAIRSRWSYTAVREATVRLEGEIERCFAAFASSTR
jgi:glutamate-ammonia-ligase adenylyltransferase